MNNGETQVNSYFEDTHTLRREHSCTEKSWWKRGIARVEQNSKHFPVSCSPSVASLPSHSQLLSHHTKIATTKGLQRRHVRTLCVLYTGKSHSKGGITIVEQHDSLILLKRCERNVATPLLPRNMGSLHSPPSMFPCSQAIVCQQPLRSSPSTRHKMCQKTCLSRRSELSSSKYLSTHAKTDGQKKGRMITLTK